MSASAVGEIFAAFDTRKIGCVSAEDAAEIAAVFGPFPTSVTFATDETFTADAIASEIERASEGDAAQRATAVFTSAFGADAKADEASLAALCSRVTGEAESSASALRVLATFNARRVAGAEFAALDDAARVEVPSRSKRALVAKRCPKKDPVVSQEAKDRHAVIDAAFSAVGAWETPAELDSAVAQWAWEGGLAETGDAIGVVARCGDKIQNIPAPKSELPVGARTVFKVQRNSAGHIWLSEGSDIATVASGVLAWEPRGDAVAESALFAVTKCESGVQFGTAEKTLTSSGSLVADNAGTTFALLTDVAARVVQDEADKPAEEKPAAEETPATEEKGAEEEKPATEEAAAEAEKPAQDEKPAEEKPAEEKPAEEKPVEEKPAEEMPAEEAS